MEDEVMRQDKTDREEGESSEGSALQPPRQEAEELKAKVEALYQAMLRDIAENGVDWAVYTGPGK